MRISITLDDEVYEAVQAHRLACKEKNKPFNLSRTLNNFLLKRFMGEKPIES